MFFLFSLNVFVLSILRDFIYGFGFVSGSVSVPVTAKS